MSILSSTLNNSNSSLTWLLTIWQSKWSNSPKSIWTVFIALKAFSEIVCFDDFVILTRTGINPLWTALTIENRLEC